MKMFEEMEEEKKEGFQNNKLKKNEFGNKDYVDWVEFRTQIVLLTADCS